jgi:hypothetical protein
MVYADFDFYQNDYFGQTIQESDFPRLALRASAFLDYYTQGRAEAHADLPALKMACCELAEQYAVIDAANAAATKAASETMEGGAEVQSESVGSWSKSYRSGGSTATEALTVAQNAKSALADIARRHLAGTGLLYRGGCCR